MKRFSLLAAYFLVCVVSGSSAEIYQGIVPYSSLGDVKKLFPKARFKKMDPAWAQERDAMYTVTGKGIAGTIVIKFNDYRPVFRKRLEEASDNDVKGYLKPLSEESEDDALVVVWVRWVPDVPFPVERIIARYGTPERSDFSPEDFQPQKIWDSRGILATLSDDGKNVFSIEYEFTDKEWKDAWEAKQRRLDDAIQETIQPKQVQ